MKWMIDPAYSTIEFTVPLLGITTIRGRFGRVQGTINATEDGELKSVEAFILAGSVDTAVPERDKYLCSADFLDAANHPVIVFKSTAVGRVGPAGIACGEIVIRDEVHPTVVDVETDPIIADPKGRQRTGATVAGTFSRKKWGLAQEQILPLAGLLVGGEVRFVLDVEAIGPKSSPSLTPATA